MTTGLLELPLKGLHAELGGKFVPFAGYSMPVQYAAGVMAEHLWTREKAGLFDVSHMGQVRLPLDQASALERIAPIEVEGLAEGRQRYGFLTNEAGGLVDDFMIARYEDCFVIVINAARRAEDLALFEKHLTGFEVITDRALLALQGPLAESALARLLPDVATLRFMDVRRLTWQGSELWLSRSGYTGEDGFEISVPVPVCNAFARALLAMDEVAPIGLGARDSLRMEAGLPLHGNDLSETISPVEAGLSWGISKSRRPDGAKAGGYLGVGVIASHLAGEAARKRIGLVPEGRAPMRGGVPLFLSETSQTQIGEITSGGFSPSLGHPIAMALVQSDTDADAPIWGELRGKRHLMRQVDLPFFKTSYKR
ncbi:MULTISPECIES: glycine cleavage system aminomethyltransferase GcvT [unclassified Roseobacter]|uniref:glycine cleavage system aminomethyltransferase GcvT n=1 Tax=unclassified Roseobacter TaxID=196798 RepID=UPI0030EB5478